MSLNETPMGERRHIAFFGRINAGKSSLVNAFTGQGLSIVSEKKGTTTDPVKKAMELLPLGPVVIIDTPGINDTGELGEQRISRALDILKQTDIAILTLDALKGFGEPEKRLTELFRQENIPYINVFNKSDLLGDSEKNPPSGGAPSIFVSAKTGENITALKELAAGLIKEEAPENTLIGDLVSQNDKIILVVPIDEAAPKGRLILPQQQVIRDALEHGALPLVCRDDELSEALDSLKEPPRMVITDSQAFDRVNRIVPKEIPLTSFSILMARYKGNFEPALKGAYMLKEIEDNDRILISEGCTHHRQCGDIGSVKLPALIRKFTKKEPVIELSSGTSFPGDLSSFRLIIHCGACMLNKREAMARYKRAGEQNIPITNYGMAIAFMNGILERSISLFDIKL